MILDEINQVKKVNKVNRKKRKYLSFSLFFPLFLGFFMVFNIITKDKTFSESENRALALRPKFSIDRFIEGRFTSKFEDYVCDQFIGRDFFTKVKITCDRFLGKNESNGVFLCDDGYLLENFKKPNEKVVKQNLQAINNFANKYKKINQYMMISPTSVSILKDKLPKWAPVIDQNKYINSYKNRLNKNIHFVDVYKSLYDHRDKYIFYKTDHHWTSLGASCAYMKLCGEMNLDDTPLDYYREQLVSNNFLGSLSSKSGYNVKPDDVNIYLPTQNNENVVVNYVQEQEKSATLYNSKSLDKKDKYEVFLKGNHPLVKIKTNTANTNSILIFKDSYANSMIPFLIKDFSNIILVDSRYYYEDIDKLIKDEHINNILYLYNANTFFEDTSLSIVLNNE